MYFQRIMKKMKEYLDVIKTCGLFAGVEADDAVAMLGCLGARKLQCRKGEYIFRAGERAESMGIVLAGSAFVVHESFWGDRHIVTRLHPGQLFAESFACTPGAVLNVGIVADAPVTAMLLDVRRVLTTCPSGCAFHQRVIRNLLSVLAGKNLDFNEKLTHLGQRTTRQKVLSYLSAEALRQGRAAFEIPFSRQQLADYLAVDRSALSSELSKLQSKGVLSFHKNHFELLEQTDF